MFRRLFLSLGISVLVSLAVTAWVRLRELRKTWGVMPAESSRRLQGDELVPNATIVETRGIDIDAPVASVWPWLVQMGFGRGGWYSYDSVDMVGASADTILPEYQSIALGDIMPTHPGGGFRVEILEPEQALALYLDTELVRSQAAAMGAGEGVSGTTPGAGESLTPGLQAAGAVGNMTMPEFRASWAFVLEPLGTGRTRLIERFRVWAPVPTTAQRLFMPIMGYGVFLMTRRQLLGIKERAESLPAPAPSAVAPAPVVTVPVLAEEPEGSGALVEEPAAPDEATVAPEPGVTLEPGLTEEPIVTEEPGAAGEPGPFTPEEAEGRTPGAQG
jgi:hypothetical protein